MTTTNVALDPAEGRALAKAIERLPAQAAGSRCQPLTPSLRAVLDRFLSAPLRTPLRSLGSPGGPVAVAIDGLAIGATTAPSDTSPDPTEAVALWLLEAAGLFPAPGPGRGPAAVPAPRSMLGGVSHQRHLWSDHVLLLVKGEPPADDDTIGCAPLAPAMADLETASVDALARHRYRPIGETGGGRADAGSPLPVLVALGPTMALRVNPRLVVGLEPEAERARRQLLDALDARATTIDLALGTGVLANRRRCLIDDDIRGLWLHRMDLVIDPWSPPARPTGEGRIGHRDGERP